jgi:TatD DNase family protein
MVEFINIHTHRAEKSATVFSIVNVTLPRSLPPADSCFSVGWHPWYINGVSLQQIDSTLESFIQHEKMIAIGETGFDRTIDTPIDFQTEVLNLHIELAKRTGKPIIIHCVKAYSDFLHTLKGVDSSIVFIIHGYTANHHITEQLLCFNTYFSIGKEILRPLSKITEILKLIPVERLFFETDEAGFSVSDIYIRAAQLLEMPLAKLVGQVRQNFINVFGNGLVEQDKVTGR